jgi:hypothetical protein
MNKIHYFLIALFALVFVLPGKAAAQGMMDFGRNDPEANQNLSDDEYEKLGEQWMQAMMGDNHEAADENIEQMMGEDFLQQMHVAMGKQSQNPGSFGMMGMMNMMTGGGGNPMMGNFSNNPMGTFGWGLGSLLFTLTWAVWLIVGILAAVWLWKQIKNPKLH